MENSSEYVGSKEFYTSYKKIRNRFRKYSSTELISHCIKYLYAPVSDEIEQLKKNPWLVLLLIKWIIKDNDFSETYSKKQLTPNQFYDILQMMKDLTIKVRMPNEYSNPLLFMRNLAYQQQYCQFDFDKNQLGRQKLLFDNVNENHLFKREFKKITGLSINVFLELSLATISKYLLNNTPNISINWFGELRKIYNNNVEIFCKSLSRNFNDLREELVSSNGKQIRPSELYEETPFIRFPFIATKSEYICVYPKVLFRSVENYIYDTLREWNAPKFMSKFGTKFEDYIEMGLEYTGVQYIREKKLDKELSGDGKVTDFLVSEKNANVFIEAKAVEMAHLGKVTHLAKIVQDKVKNSIVCAIKQSHDVLKRLSKTKSTNPIITEKENNYLLVVTFKELYLLNGKVFYDNIAKDKLDSIVGEYQDYTCIPFENMYFITISDFDYLVELVKQNKFTFSSALEKAKEDDRDPETMKFDFSMHLNSWGKNLKLPQYLEDASESIFDKLSDILRH